jgi:hypothetical protein
LALPAPAMAQEGLWDGLKVVRACAGDVESLCSEITPGEGRIKACVHEKFAELSQPCLDAVFQLIAVEKEPPPDFAATSKMTRFNNLRGMRYCEVFLLGADPKRDRLYADFFNTTDLNNKSPMDTCPPDMWAKVDPEALKKQFDVLGVFKNGPRGWAMDRIELPAGPVLTFDGWDARWMGHVDLPKDIDLNKKGSSAYKPTQVHRDSSMTFLAGRPVHILEDSQGVPWVMQAYSDIVDPNLTYDDLAKLGDKLKLTPGWKYQVKVLDRDLTIRAVNGVAHIVQDDLENTYDACMEGARSYVP